MSYPLSPEAGTHFLEQQAEDQRRKLHETVTELRNQVRETVHEKLDVRKRARDNVWPAAGTAFLFTLLFGYGTAGTIKHMLR
jgi:hypothetical protein